MAKDTLSKRLTQLKQQDIFHNLTDKELQQLANSTKKVEYSEGVTLLQEGEISTQMYLLLKGRVSILKWDENKTQEFVIQELTEGSLFGEMAFIDKTARSTSVKTIEACQLLFIDTILLQTHNTLYNKIIANIAQLNVHRLRNSNLDYVKSLKAQIEEFKLRNEFGRFFITVIVTLGLGESINKFVTNYQIDSRNTWFNWTYLLIVLLPICFFVRQFHYPLHMFGVTIKRWKKSLYESIILSVITVILFFTGFAVYGLLYNPAALYRITHPDTRFFHVIFLTYFVHSYLQEFIARGVTQSSLQRFLNDKTGFESILITSCIFGIFHLHIGFLMGLITFLGGVYFGWIYNRSKNLIGVSLVHFIMGACLIYVGLL